MDTTTIEQLTLSCNIFSVYINCLNSYFNFKKNTIKNKNFIFKVDHIPSLNKQSLTISISFFFLI